jgi:hypothetical protein
VLPIASTVVPASLREDGPVALGPDEHERALRRVHRIAVDLEPRPAAEDDVELLVALVLLVLGHQAVADVLGCPRVRPEGGDPEVVPHGAQVRALAVVDVLELIGPRDPIGGQSSPIRAASSHMRIRTLLDPSSGPQHARA